MTRWVVPSAAMTSRQVNQVSGKPCSRTTAGPAPPTTACMTASPTSTFLAVKPSGSAPQSSPATLFA